MRNFHARDYRWPLALLGALAIALLAGAIFPYLGFGPGRMAQAFDTNFHALVARVTQQIAWTEHCKICGITVYWLVRGPLGALYDSGDFLTVYAAARCWLQGLNPYDLGDLVSSARSAGVLVNDLPVTEAFFVQTPSVYLPPALLLFAPFALLDWSQAKILFLCVSLAAVVSLLASVARLSPKLTVPGLLFLLAFAPLQTAFVKGQPTLLVCALIAASLMASRPSLRGVLLGLAVCIKPQLGLGFLLLALCKHEHKRLLAAALTAFTCSLAACLPLTHAALPTLLENLASVSAATGINSGSPLNPMRYQLLNIDTLLPASLYGPVTIGVLYALIVAISAMALLACRDRRLAIGLVAAATLLIGYHRVYDAMILWLGIPALLLPWALLPAILLRAGYASFLVSGQTIAANSAFVQAHAADALGFLLLHHQTLACLLIWALLLAGAIRPPLAARRRPER